MTVELGQTQEPVELIPGQPGVIEDNVRVLRERASAAHDTGEALREIDAGGWRGEAADRWHEQHQTDVPRWMQGGDSLEAAAAALEEYAATLRWAQGQAGEAIRLWQEAEAATRRAKAAYDQQAAQAAGPLARFPIPARSNAKRRVICCGAHGTS